MGDSGCQIKPLTYGGIYMGMRGAEMLADCLIEKKLNRYPSLWMRRFGKEIAMAQKARELFTRLSDTDVQEIFSFAKKKKHLIETRGDFENHSSVVWDFLRYPDLSKELLGLLFKIIKANLPARYESGQFTK